MMTGNRPDVGHLRVFGSKAFVHIPKEKRNKLDFKGAPGHMVGYSINSKGYRILMEGNYVIDSRDVIFERMQAARALTITLCSALLLMALLRELIHCLILSTLLRLILMTVVMKMTHLLVPTPNHLEMKATYLILLYLAQQLAHHHLVQGVATGPTRACSTLTAMLVMARTLMLHTLLLPWLLLLTLKNPSPTARPSTPRQQTSGGMQWMRKWLL
jgi:hypothetical protein